ncbi:MAG: DUF2163 domain-containing protein [Pseudomonadota bacterium]
MSDPYTDRFASGSTTLCRCFRLVRADGVEMGFTDHDEDVAFDGLTYAASAALSASDAASSLGLAPDEMDAQGGLSHDAISEADLVAGVYDAARVEVWDVDWSDPAVRKLLGRYTVGQVERGGVAFRTELRSLSAILDTPQGRMHTTLCDARRLGDGRCRLSLSAWQGTATVLAINGLELTVSGIEDRTSGFFDRGTVDWTDGANAGSGGDVRLSRNDGASTNLSLWRLPPHPIAPGDTLYVTAGCDRTADMCRNRFGNLLNFRGFPHMPGETSVTEYAVSGDPNQNGGSRFG